MDKPTGQIRDEIYAYIEAKGLKLNNKDRGFISGKVKEHSENREINLKDIVRRHSFTQEKVSKYLKKANELPQTEKIKAQIQTLELVSSWLNEDVE